MATSSGPHVGRKRHKKSLENHDSSSVDSSSSDDEIHSPIKSKKPCFNFDADDFREQLKGSFAFEKLTNFLVACGQYEEGSSTSDPVDSYLQISTQCAEILNLLDEEKRPPGENKTIFEVITAILLRITEDLPQHASTAVHIVNRLLRGHIRHIYRGLNASKTAKIIMASLKLLAAMVTHSSVTAKEVVALFRLDHDGLLGLVSRTDKKAPEDVRICMLRFMMSFLISNDGQVIEQLLSHRDLMKSIFKGLQRDRISTLHLVLPTMQQYIVCNPSVNKTQKLKLFNDYTLPQIAHLYDWQGIDDMEEHEDGKAVVRELVHRFLLEITCDHKHGINFHDKTMGTSGKSNNATLLKFALTQKNVNQDGLVEELVCRILQTCPDVLPGYLSKCSLTFAPRSSHVWKTNMSFVIKVYTSIDVNSMVLNLQNTHSVSRMVSTAMATTIPSVLTQTLIIQGLKQGGAVTSILLDFMLFILKQVQRIKDACCANSLSNMQMFLTSFYGAVVKTLPDVNTVLPVWQRVLQLWINERSGNTKPKVEDAKGLPAPNNLEVLCKLLQVLSAYQQVLPAAFEQTSHDFTLMIPSIFKRIQDKSSDESEGTNQASLLQLRCDCLTFLMGFPSGRFRWFKEMKGEGTAMSRLLKELTSDPQPELYQGLTAIVNKILQETCLFEHSPSEASIWLTSIMTLDLSDRSKVVTFLQSCLTKAIRNPHPYNDKIADCATSAQSSRQQGCNGEDGAVSKPFDIKDIPDVNDISVDPYLDAVTSDATQTECDCKMLWPDPPMPCSALLPVVLEKFMQEPDIPDAVATYLGNVTTMLIHQQVDPLPLCLLLQQYAGEGKPASEKWSQMLKYCSYWVLGKKPAKKFASVKVVDTMHTFSALLQGSLECGAESLLTDVFWSRLLRVIEDLESDEMLPAVQHVLLYLHTVLNVNSQVRRDSSLVDLVEKYMSVIDQIMNLAIKAADVSEVKPGQTSKVKCQMVKVILQHPVCTYWFQRKEQAGHEAILYDVKTIQQLSKVITGYCLKFLSNSKTALKDDEFESCLKQYAKKTFVDLKFAVDAFGAIPSSSMEDFVMEDEPMEITKTGEDALGKHEVTEDQSVSIFSLLGSHINISEVRTEVVSACLKQPQLLVQGGADGGNTVLSPMGRVISALATMCSRSEPRIGGVLAGVLQTSNCDEFGRILILMLKMNKNVVLFTTKEMLSALLNEPTEMRAKVAAQLIEQSFAHRCHFEAWCEGKPGQRSMKKHKVLMLSVLISYCKAWNDSTETNKGATTLKLLWDIFWPWISEWFVHNETHGQYTTASDASMAEAFTCLLRIPKVLANVVVSLLQRILSVSLKEERNFNRGKELSAIADNFGSNQEISTLVLAIQLHQMTVASKDGEDSQDRIEEAVQKCHDHLRKNHNTISLKHCPEILSIWKQCIRSVLKDHYTNSVLDLIASLVGKLYEGHGDDGKVVPLERLYQMIVSHSQFLPSMLAENEKKEEGAERDINQMKASLARLMFVIASQEPSCCQTAHYAVLLGAYSASLQKSDRYLLALMNVYERNDAIMWDYRPYMWGSVAITQHAARKSLGQNLWQQPTMREVLELLDPTKLHESTLKFPLDRKLIEPDTDLDSSDSEVEDCYDPCFLLPLFSHLLAPECVADCKKFAECHALEFTLAALGSHDTDMRTAAYHVLAGFYNHLIGALMMGKRELLYLIESLRNSVTKPDCRVPNVVALFIGQIATVMMSPAQHIYPVLVQFLTIKPEIQMTAVPLFQRLFYSTNLKHDKERDWMMQLLLNGLRDLDDFKVYDKSGVFKTLLAFQPAVLCGDHLKSTIFELLKTACGIAEAAHVLVRQHSLLTWIDAHIDNECTINELEPIISLLHTLSKSLFIKTDVKSSQEVSRLDTTDEKSGSVEEIGDENTNPADGSKGRKENLSGRKLPDGTRELFFVVCMRVLDYMNPVSSVKPHLLLDYLETLASLSNKEDKLPLRTHHIAVLLNLYARVFRIKTLFDDLVKVGLCKEKVLSPETSGFVNEEKDSDAKLYKQASQSLLAIVMQWRISTNQGKRTTKSHAEGRDNIQKSGKIVGHSKVQERIGEERFETNDLLVDSKVQKFGRKYPERDDRTDKLVQIDSDDLILLVIKWVLSTVSNIGTNTQFESALTFVNDLISTNPSVSESLAHGNEDCSREIVDLLMALYSRNDDATYSGVNAVFMLLVSEMSAEGGKLSPAVMKKYQKALDLCAKTSDAHRQLTAILMQELWSGCHQPTQFWTALDHCMELNTPPSDKRGTPASQKRRRSLKKTPMET